ncbi:MAG: hypothetical protein ACO3JL_15040, partial [Myxococcota bacterium]
MTLRAKVVAGGWLLTMLMAAACGDEREGEPVARSDTGPLPPAGDAGATLDGGLPADSGTPVDDAGGGEAPSCEPEGATRSGGACGLNGRGTLLQRCSAGDWADTEECSDPDECIDDDERLSTAACGLNDRGALVELCVLGRFESTDDCEDADQCIDDEERIGDTPCGSGGPFVFEQRCAIGQWVDTDICLDTTPVGWTCDHLFYADGVCDCGCGVVDT